MYFAVLGMHIQTVFGHQGHDDADVYFFSLSNMEGRKD